MFRMIGFGENLGSGFPLILSAWNEKHWLEPELFEQTDLRQVKLILHIRPENGGKDGGKELSDRQSLILSFLSKNPSASVNEVAKNTMIRKLMSKRTVEREISLLQRTGILSRVGGRKEGRWVVNIDFSNK